MQFTKFFIMKTILSSVLIAGLIGILAGCSSARKMSRDYVPFTSQLKQRLERDSIDIKKVQFYVDQKLILSRYLDDERAQVTSGKVRFENGKYINEVIIPPFTPGVCEEIQNGNLMISFEKGSSDMGFGLGSGFTANTYVLYGYDWRNGTAIVNFDNKKFRVRCATCTDVAMTRLLIKKNVVDKVEKKTHVLSGNKVE